MTEISTFMDQPPVGPVVAPNGHVEEGEPTLPRVDPARSVFVTSRGDEIELSNKPISALILERLMSEGKPKIPMVEVTLMGKHKQLEAHPEHPGYKALLAEWEQESKLRTMRYIFTVGVKGQPPQDFIDDQRDFFPNATDGDLKYLWVAAYLPENDIDAFTDAVLGRSVPTAKGLEASANFTGSKSAENP